ncbi:hypothetical protein DV701_04545 [Ornithinimicrobium avium]|uniref:Type VI secretion protein n=1 Tax=Ornithinimicrobium avium TaxID=2283195 RepID=A0A345NKD8_9MICO|nr:hypothetical protein DV701_04545 [Ornithinimicrobium avium]
MPSAARVGDPTSHGGVVVGPGVPTVLVGGLPAASPSPAPARLAATHQEPIVRSMQ